ncbi:Heat stress transcription factor A-8 [Hibiscus syriacus]|uniref:Heat stress transcription factor A-8 n=1 Tax=Hibiscus syriacus TaxID=106335 RepID=A0A6A3BL21_HIBSY|nr:heat stress transcription factor A-8-like [Hibiscus syriacus]KAE8716128.1 Heat stress transcription factor A-8 [Hibiscus syriacus]
MVKSSENRGQSIAPFLRKCFEMVDDEATDSIISWNQNNDGFIIWDITEFSVRFLPQYFKHSNFSSFIRQLNIYGFRKTDPDRWEFANDGFIRGQKDLLKNIVRRKYSQGSEQHKSLQQQQPENSVESCENTKNIRLWKEVENLKTDKNALTQELVKLGQYQQIADNKLLLLNDRLQGMEESQQQLLSFLIMAMQSPGFLVQLIQPKESNWRMAEVNNMLEQVTEDAEPVASDHMIVQYQPPTIGAPPLLAPIIESENHRESDSSSDGMKDFWMDVDFVEALMDDSQMPLVQQPDLHDFGAWEKLLLPTDFPANNDDESSFGKIP